VSEEPTTSAAGPSVQDEMDRERSDREGRLLVFLGAALLIVIVMMWAFAIRGIVTTLVRLDEIQEQLDAMRQRRPSGITLPACNTSSRDTFAYEDETGDSRPGRVLRCDGSAWVEAQGDPAGLIPAYRPPPDGVTQVKP